LEQREYLKFKMLKFSMVTGESQAKLRFD
jgi:hypothetical protein